MSTCTAVRPLRPVTRQGDPARRGRRPVRLTRRGRVVLVCFLLVLALGVSFLVLRTSSVATNQSGDLRYRTVVVEPGQTLWQLAREADPGADPRVTISRIMKFNALSSPVVQPGQRIAVPERG